MPVRDFTINTGLEVSGSTRVSGSVSASGGFTGSLQGTASYGQEANLLDGRDSTEFALTGSTNYFKADQIVSGSLTVTASLTASSLTGTDLNIDYIDFVPQPNATPPAQQVGRVFVDDLYNEVNTWTDVTGVKLLQGQQLVLRAKCTDMATFTKGTVVRINGGTGANATFVTASWENDTNSADTLGFLMNSGVINDFAYIIINGYLTDINTDGYTPGQTIYLSSSGNYTNVIPAYPYHEVRLGQVVRAHANVGSVFVRVQNGYELGELHDVYTSSLNPGDLLVYEDGVNAQWTNKKVLSGSYQLTGGLNVSGNISASTITGTFSGIVNGVANITTGTNLTSSLAGGNLVINLTSSITGGLDNISGTTNIITNTLTSSNDINVNTIRVGLGNGSSTAVTTTNTVVGYDTLTKNTTGIANIAIGYQALSNNTVGLANTAIGYQSLSSSTTGQQNTGIGIYALYKNTTGNYNIGIGPGALNSITTGQSNIAIGAGAISSSVLGGSNIAIGTSAMANHKTGSNNIFIGQSSGVNIVSSDSCVIIGRIMSTVLEGQTGSVIISDGAGKIKIIADNNNTVTVPSGSLFVSGGLTVSGSVTLGDATTDTITLNAATMSLGNGTGVLNIDSNTLYVDGNNNKVGFGTNSIATSALVEMSGTNVGLLFPRVSGSARATMTGATGLIVYQTDTSGSDAEGLYIYKSSGWVQII